MYAKRKISFFDAGFGKGFTFFSFAIDSYIDETDFTLGLSQKYHF